MFNRQFVSFNLGEHLFGLDILFVREIISGIGLTPVDQTPTSVCGLLNLRGQIITVIDPSVAMGMHSGSTRSGSYCIILKTARELSGFVEEGLICNEAYSEPIGLLVDSISNVVSSDSTSLDAPPANITGLDVNYLSGVLKLEDRILLILSLRTLINNGIGMPRQTQDVVA